MTDLIKREDAIKAVDAFLGTDPIVERIKRLPSADRPQGEWIVDEEQGTSTCSNCGIRWQFTDGTNGSNFCPNCGADMSEVRDE